MSAAMKPPHFNGINRRGCPGSYATAKVVSNGKAVCPFCFREYYVNENGTLRGHRRR